jgi:uncharacterized protein
VDIFAVPVGKKFLFYAPLHQLTALVNLSALHAIRDALLTGDSAPPGLQPIIERLRTPPIPVPTARTGPLTTPLFLGIISTRGCNLACRYCDFAAPKSNSEVMDLALARRAVDSYLNLVCEAGNRNAEVHFFGGEPFYAETVIHFVVEYAASQAAALGLTVRFEATTNGLYNTTRCRWIADHFDAIVLSLDGTPDIQECHRPSLNGHKTADIIVRNARILSEGSVELILRSCITRDTVQRMPEIARWIGREFRPSTVCFETLNASPLSEAAHFAPPDPWEFAQNFDAAAGILQAYGIETVMSSADLRTCRASFCPVGKDALIVSPDGAVDACYLLKKDWEKSGLDLRLGRLNGKGFEIDPAALQSVRDLTVHQKPLCADCFCRYHCAGGCHVNHSTAAAPGEFDNLCVQTRLITIATLLRQIGQHALADAWLGDRDALEAAVWQKTDRLCIEEPVL